MTEKLDEEENDDCREATFSTNWFLSDIIQYFEYHKIIQLALVFIKVKYLQATKV